MCNSKTQKLTVSTISTERLYMLPSVDSRDLGSYISDLLLTKDFYFQYGQPYSDELLESIDFHSTGVVYYSIFLKDTGIMIGYMGILPHEDNPACGDLEFYIFKEFRRCGFCKEALTSFIDNFFIGSLTGIKGMQVEAETLSDNEISCRLLESIGFRRKSSGIRAFFDDDGELDKSKTKGLYRYDLEKQWKV